MLRNFVILMSLIIAISACSSKPKEGEEILPGITDQPDSGAAIDSDSGKVDGLFSINFPYDQVTLTPESEDKLQKNADWLKTNGKSTLQIEGHCDSRGSIEYNLSLGERRARKVKSFLVGLGVDEKRLTVLSYGEERPLDSTDSEEAFSKNRRANFVPLTE